MGHSFMRARWMQLPAKSKWLGAISLLALYPLPVMAADVKEVGVPSQLPDETRFVFKSAEQPTYQVDVVVSGLKNMYSIDFLPNGDALVVERGVAIRLVEGLTGETPRLLDAPIANVPNYEGIDKLHPFDVFGIQDVMLDPNFVDNNVVYFTYNRPVGFDADVGRITASTVVARATLEDGALINIEDMLVGEPMVAVGGSRLVMANGYLYVSVGALSEGDIQSAQRLDSIYGKVLRITPDGAIPADNPFMNDANARKEIWTFGHRDPLGLAVHPATGRMVASEHGPQGGDELNELRSGVNYGWPNWTYGTEYAGSDLLKDPVGAETQGPIVFWSPSIAPNGIAFYTGDLMPEWKGNLFVASARRGQINGTGALIRLVFNADLQELRQEVLIDDLHQRIKDVQQGPDGRLYVVTDEASSVILRVGPETAR